MNVNRARYRAYRDNVLRAYEFYGDCNETDNLRDLPRFVMVEKNEGGCEPSHYVTTWDLPHKAGDYHVHQDYAHDWSIELFLDLDHPDRRYVESMTFVVVP